MKVLLSGTNIWKPDARLFYRLWSTFSFFNLNDVGQLRKLIYLGVRKIRNFVIFVNRIGELTVF